MGLILLLVVLVLLFGGGGFYLGPRDHGPKGHDQQSAQRHCEHWPPLAEFLT